MTNLESKVIMITTKCSASCAHCPFSDRKMPKVEISLEKLQQLIESSREALCILSGGEPFEHSQIDLILNQMMSVTKKFRIATGGHIDLHPYVSKIESLLSLEGISLGTDHYLLKNTPKKDRENFEENLNLITKKQIPYSITMTIISEINFVDVENLLISIKLHSRIPQFFYLRYKDEDVKIALNHLIKKHFEKVDVLEDKVA